MSDSSSPLQSIWNRLFKNGVATPKAAVPEPSAPAAVPVTESPPSPASRGITLLAELDDDEAVNKATDPIQPAREHRPTGKSPSGAPRPGVPDPSDPGY